MRHNKTHGRTNTYGSSHAKPPALFLDWCCFIK